MPKLSLIHFWEAEALRPCECARLALTPSGARRNIRGDRKNPRKNFCCVTTRGLGLMWVAWWPCWGESLVVSFVLFFGVRPERVVGADGETDDDDVAVSPPANA